MRSFDKAICDDICKVLSMHVSEDALGCLIEETGMLLETKPKFTLRWQYCQFFRETKPENEKGNPVVELNCISSLELFHRICLTAATRDFFDAGASK